MKSEFHDKDDKDDKDDKYKKHQQTNNIDSKPSNIFNYLKSLSPEASDLMDEIEEDDDDIDINKLCFIGSDKQKFNFNTFRMPLNFLQDIYNEKISLKEAKFEQRDLEKEIEKLEFNYIPKNEKEEEIDKVLMYAKSLLESRNKIIDAFKDHIFPSEHLKKTDKAAYDFMLKGVNKFIEKIKSMEEKINFSLFEDLFEFSSPADYAKTLIDISSDENKTIVAEAKDIISNLKDRIKKMSDKEKEKKMPMKHWRLLIKLLIIITRLKIFFIIHQKLIKKIRTKD